MRLLFILPAICSVLIVSDVSGQQIKSASPKIVTEGSLFYGHVRGNLQASYKVFFNPSKLRIANTQMRKGKVAIQNITIQDCSSPSTPTYLDNGKRFVFLKENVRHPFIKMGKHKSNEIMYEYLPDTLTINGFKCKKALLKLADDSKNEVAEVWFTPEYKIDPSCFEYLFEGLNGLPVKITSKDDAGLSFGADVTSEYTLEKLSAKLTQPIDFIEGKEKYETIEEAQKFQVALEMMGMSGSQGGNLGITFKKEMTSADSSTKVTLTSYNPFKIGKKLPDFQGKSIDGSKVNFSNFKGKALVLNFWFIGCAPCVKEMPILDQVSESYNNRNVAFVSMTYDKIEEVTRFLQKHPFKFQHVIDAREAINKYGVSSYPLTVITDKNGIVRFVKAEEFKDAEELKNEIEFVLK